MTPEVGEASGVLEKATSWAYTQPAYIVLLSAILAAIGYGAWYGVPAALNQVQEGYDQLDRRHVDAVNSINSAHAAERKELRDDAKFERERLSEELRSNQNKFTSSIEKAGEAIQRLNDQLNTRDRKADQDDRKHQ